MILCLEPKVIFVDSLLSWDDRNANLEFGVCLQMSGPVKGGLDRITRRVKPIIQ